MTASIAIPHPKPPELLRRRRRRRLHEFIGRMRQRRREKRLAYRSAFSDPLPARRRKRKGALALSASVMAFGTAATGTDLSMIERPAAARALVPGIDMRAGAADLTVSEEMKEALAEEEGVRLTVYRDVAGFPTVGVGHLVTAGDGLSVGDRISYDRAIDFLEEDLRTAEDAVVRLVGNLPLYQNEFDALVDLVYNVGEGNVSDARSPRLNRAIDAHDYDKIASELHYHRANGKKARGLAYRSERRAQIFMDASYDNPREGVTDSPLQRG